jgi:hypothetical protein
VTPADDRELDRCQSFSGVQGVAAQQGQARGLLVATGPRDGDGEKGTPARQPGHPGTDHGDAGSPGVLHRPLFGMAKRIDRKREQAHPAIHPKGASFKDYPPDRLKRIQHRLNERPRKKLDFNTPKVEFYKQFM